MKFAALGASGSLAPATGFVVALLAVGWIFPAAGSADLPDGSHPYGAYPDTAITFTNDILSIFQNRCVECHGGTSESGQVIIEAYLDLLTYEGVMAGSEFGLVIEPGDPEASVLIEMLESGDMPEEGDPVPPEEIELIRAWIEAGAPEG